MKKEDNKGEACKEGCDSKTVQVRQHSFIEILKDPQATKGLENLVVNLFNRYSQNAKGHRLFLGFCFTSIVAAVTLLSFHDAMTPSAGVILGALAGYLFGKDD